MPTIPVLIIIEGAATEAKMSAESRTLARESLIRPMYFEARITRILYTLGRSCDPLDHYATLGQSHLG